MRRIAKNRAGLTLVEMLVVLALTLFIMTIMTGLIVQATEGMNQARGIAKIDQSLRSAVTILRTDLNDVFLQGATSLGTAFSAATEVPTGGYFMYEENSPAVRQGLDSWGIPVELDFDDVLAFTTRKNGTSEKEMYYGVVFRDTPPTDYQLHLDNYGALARHDEPDNGVTSSQFAEIVYFLRPDGKQYTLDELRTHDGTTPKDLTPGLTKVSTFTLYRRQLLILPDSFIDASASLNVTPIPTVDFYKNYDLSGIPSAAAPANIELNRITNIDERRRRFGMNPGFGATTSDYPFSWTSSSSGTSASTATIFALDNSGDWQWFGRPISLETNYSLGNPPTGGHFEELATEFPTGNIDTQNTNGVIDAGEFDALDTAWNNAASLTHRFGNDVLLENVLSFDVKVYDDDPRVEPDPDGAGGPAVALDSLPTVAVNVDRTVGDPDERVPDFIDLGYRGVVDMAGGVSLNDIYDDAATDYYSYAAAVARGEVAPPARWRNVGRTNPALAGSATVYSPVRTYDTWSDELGYEPDPTLDPNYRPIPYPKPLRALQIKIRVLEPKSGIVRDVKVVHRF